MTLHYDVTPGHEQAQRKLVEAALRELSKRPGIVGAHLCLGDATASAVQTTEKKSRPTQALTPNWVVLVEGGAERGTLEDACAELLPTNALIDAGALALVAGLYQFQFQVSPATVIAHLSRLAAS